MPVAIRITAATVSLAVLLLGGCAAAPPDTDVAEAPAQDCVRTTGSTICRKADGTNADNLGTMSGDEFRRRGAPVGSPTTTPIGN